MRSEGLNTVMIGEIVVSRNELIRELLDGTSSQQLLTRKTECASMRAGALA